MKRWLPHVLIGIGLVVLAVLLRGRDRGPNPPGSPAASQAADGDSETPEAIVSAFFDAAGRGEIERYLGLVTGDLRTSLEGTRSQLGDDGFRRNIQRTAAGVKGLATYRSAEQPVDGIALDVELVFVDRNEKQRFTLRQARGRWRIAAIGPATAAKPAIPYGTPVFEE